jgi:hypothetical protein
MTCEEILDQAIAMLQRRWRPTSGALKRPCQREGVYLEEVTNARIEGQCLAVDERGRVLVWTGRASTPPAFQAPGRRRGLEAAEQAERAGPPTDGFWQRRIPQGDRVCSCSAGRGSVCCSAMREA